MIWARTYVSSVGDTSVRVCCSAMSAALQAETDSTGYGPFARVAPDGSIDLSTYDLPEAKFCPWCRAPMVAEIGRAADTVKPRAASVGGISRSVNFEWKTRCVNLV